MAQGLFVPNFDSMLPGMTRTLLNRLGSDFNWYARKPDPRGVNFEPVVSGVAKKIRVIYRAPIADVMQQGLRREMLQPQTTLSDPSIEFDRRDAPIKRGDILERICNGEKFSVTRIRTGNDSGLIIADLVQIGISTRGLGAGVDYNQTDDGECS